MRQAAAAVAIGLLAVVAIVAVSLESRGRSRVSLLVTGGTVVTVDAAGTVIPDGAVAIDGSTIVAVGPRGPTSAAATRRRQTIDARGQIVLPGLINAHTHAPMVLYRGLADDLALMDWLTKYIFPAEKATVSPEFVRVRDAAGCIGDDRIGHDDVRRHVLLRGGRRPGHARSRSSRRARAERDSVPRGRRLRAR